MQWGLNVHQQPRQLDKRFADLKLCQREQIAKWLREETNDYYTRHQRYPVGRGQRTWWTMRMCRL